MARCVFKTFAFLVSLGLVVAPRAMVEAQSHATSSFGETERFDSLSASDILDNGIQALGGQAALESMKTVSMRALSVDHNVA